MNYASNITELIGNTPLVKINKGSQRTQSMILGKCEFMNPTGSVKDRIGFNMIERALLSGKLTVKSELVEPTSGNTGIALASVAAGLGIPLTLTMPSSMSMERRRLLSALGAKIVLTEPAKGMAGAVERAKEIAETTSAVLLQQFENPANPAIHVETTAEEIWRDTEGKVDIFVAAVGTGGTITGISKVLKNYNSEIKIIAVEPELSPVLSGGQPGPHKIQGIGAGFVPKVLQPSAYDEIMQVSNEDAIARSRSLAKEEGLMVGISAGANVIASERIAASPENREKVIVTILPDTGERYISTGLYDSEDEKV
ncbi:MAG: cysteine synthase A [Campylobacterota bacterium]